MKERPCAYAGAKTAFSSKIGMHERQIQLEPKGAKHMPLL